RRKIPARRARPLRRPARPFQPRRPDGGRHRRGVRRVRRERKTKFFLTSRFDPEYFQKQHLADESLAQSRPRDFQSFADLDLTVDGSAFYPAIEDYYGTGELPFIRVADVDAVIDFENCTRIPAELCDKFPTLCRIYPGDLVFTKGGSVARIGL